MNGWLVRGPRRAFLAAAKTVESAVDIQRVWRGAKGRKVSKLTREQLKLRIRAILLIQSAVRRWRLRKRLLLEEQRAREAKRRSSLAT